ncbi:MAG TPA: hypothetical protein VFO77_01115, partial [Actinoplanes sp.]|nr:hypothetical protein [Actinoplanes sp.]
TGRLAARFQRTVAVVAAELALGAARDAGVDTVCLGGGVFANRWLLAEIPRRLRRTGVRVLHPQRVSPGDGGISFGQAAVAAARMSAIEGATTCA